MDGGAAGRGRSGGGRAPAAHLAARAAALALARAPPASEEPHPRHSLLRQEQVTDDTRYCTRICLRSHCENGKRQLDNFIAKSEGTTYRIEVTDILVF